MMPQPVKMCLIRIRARAETASTGRSAYREQEQRYQLHRHQWMVPQAKTYYSSQDEKYALNWIEVYGDWIKQNPKPEQGTDVTNHASWRPLDVAAA